MRGTIMQRGALAAIAVLVGILTRGEAGEREPGKEVKDVGLTLTLRSKKDGYKLDLQGKTIKEWEELLTVGKKLGSPPPMPPAVDLELEIKNTSKMKIDFWSDGDPVQVLLELKGPRAHTITAPLAFTADFRLPKFKTLDPGETHVIPFKKLQSGFRGIATWHYWLEPGAYTVTPRFKTAIRPVPPGVKEEEGAGQVTIVGKALTVNVTK